ncbi:MAG: F0F1 ATP synthase subunit alpha [Verrucomicrobia bacterium]|nr:F0F1 ATP synthase subunit alpha [Verrucomicrobiota bacterium]
MTRFLDRVPPRLDGRRGATLDHVGVIERIGDGIAIVSGLPQAKFNELLEFPGGVRGLVFNLDETEIGCLLLGESGALGAGDEVRATGEVIRAPVGEELVGRVVTPLGDPLDGKGRINAARFDPIEREAPPILHRSAVEVPLLTGIKSIDAMIPLGRGQRELIVGDRATGKTAIAVDAIVNQRDTGVLCIYVAIGQKTSSVARLVQDLERHGAMAYTLVVVASADDPPGMQYVAPYAACTMGEYFMCQGRDVFVVYDDLTKQAYAYREISLLLRRPPGREAYPGDIFYIHSRLLERATRLSDEHGGGSLTALPIVETQAKNLSAYIPTNLISITDGQIVLDSDLFDMGLRPAIDIGKSVSRVGGKTQLKSMRKAAGSLKLDYAQFGELELFTRFGASVEKETAAKIERGRRIREVLKQPRLDPMPIDCQVALLIAANEGVLDALPVERVDEFERLVRGRMRDLESDIMRRVREGEAMTPEDTAALATATRALMRELQ